VALSRPFEVESGRTVEVPLQRPAGTMKVKARTPSGLRGSGALLPAGRRRGVQHAGARTVAQGWYVGTIPGGKVRGKMLQYYAEARDGRDALAAANGKPGSPNVMTIKPKR